MAEPLSWSLGADGFPDLGTDLITPNQYENGNLDDIDGKYYLYYYKNLFFSYRFSTVLDCFCQQNRNVFVFDDSSQFCKYF